ncbi:7-carboxy-7-deazaguanine synthase QueE [Phytohabitans houttuyneae]|uniref:7-carboxy-7-deazaguanine synthase QueE n=1 Tax=Phytohabitans houttuyneae TaxID=1076126 RepID=UPI001FE57887|nr:7-carboxy-7-deazaguanine synthase QueE [Phytohabitans houttuyneae]
MLVAEVFGPTLQGEGPSCGQQALFVRLSRCNLSCPSCDTPYTWDRSRFDLRQHTERRTAASLISWALAYPTPLVVISGGEPLLQQDRILPIVAAWTAAGRRVEIETNGTVSPSPELVDQVAAFNVSPKLAAFAADRDVDRRINPAALAALAASGKSVFKFVAGSIGDLDEIGDLVTRFGLAPVWVMPEGITSEVIVARMRDLADAVVARGWNLTTRLHVLLWEDTRGR